MSGSCSSRAAGWITGLVACLDTRGAPVLSAGCFALDAPSVRLLQAARDPGRGSGRAFGAQVVPHLETAEDMARQNLAPFRRAATMFAPPKPSGNAADEPGEENISAHPASPATARADTSAEIKALSAKIEDPQKQICALVETRAPKD